MEKELMEKLIKALMDNISISKDGDTVTITSSAEVGTVQDTDKWETVEFDDSLVKDQVNAFKDLHNQIPDCIRSVWYDSISKLIDLKAFDELVDKDSYNESEASAVLQMIETATICLRIILKDKVEDYNNMIGLCNAILD